MLSSSSDIQLQQENPQECCLQTTTTTRSLVVVKRLREQLVHYFSQASILVQLVECLPIDRAVLGLNFYWHNILHRDLSYRPRQTIRKRVCVSVSASKLTSTVSRAYSLGPNSRGFKYLHTEHFTLQFKANSS